MLNPWGDLEAAFSWMNHTRRRLESAGGWEAWANTEGWPQMNVTEDAGTVVITAEVPGLDEKALEVTLNQGVLTVKGERLVEEPQGYQPLRRERGNYSFSRSFSLGRGADAAGVTATVKQGVLTVSVPRLPEVKPRQITVQAQ